MSKLDERLEAVRVEYGLRQDDFWELPQAKGRWCIKHSALEIVAAKAGIVFEPPIVLEADGANGVAAVCVTGTYKDRKVWSIGEASPKNTKNSYVWAICEKRAVDRVILKLVGIHGLLYSDTEIEVDSAGETGNGPRTASEPVPDTVAKLIFPIFQSDLRASATQEQLDGVWNRWLSTTVEWSDGMQGHCHEAKREMQEYMDGHDGDARNFVRDTIAGELRAAVSMEDLDGRRSKFRDAFMKLGKEQKDHLAKVVTEMTKSLSTPPTAAESLDRLAEAEKMAKIGNTL